MPNRPGIDQKIIEKTNPIKNIKRSLINTIVWWASTCLLPSFAREINIHPSTNKRRDKTAWRAPQEYDAHHQKNPKAINMIPHSNESLGFINGFNGSPVLDELGNSNFLGFFKFYSSIIVYNIIVFNTYFLFYGAVLLGVCGGRNSEGEDYPGDYMNAVVITLKFLVLYFFW